MKPAPKRQPPALDEIPGVAAHSRPSTELQVWPGAAPDASGDDAELIAFRLWRDGRKAEAVALLERQVDVEKERARKQVYSRALVDLKGLPAAAPTGPVAGSAAPVLDLVPELNGRQPSTLASLGHVGRRSSFFPRTALACALCLVAGLGLAATFLWNGTDPVEVASASPDEGPKAANPPKAAASLVRVVLPGSATPNAAVIPNKIGSTEDKAGVATQAAPPAEAHEKPLPAIAVQSGPAAAAAQLNSERKSALLERGSALAPAHAAPPPDAIETGAPVELATEDGAPADDSGPPPEDMAAPPVEATEADAPAQLAAEDGAPAVASEAHENGEALAATDPADPQDIRMPRKRPETPETLTSAVPSRVATALSAPATVAPRPAVRQAAPAPHARKRVAAKPARSGAPVSAARSGAPVAHWHTLYAAPVTGNGAAPAPQGRGLIVISPRLSQRLAWARGYVLRRRAPANEPPLPRGRGKFVGYVYVP